MSNQEGASISHSIQPDPQVLFGLSVEPDVQPPYTLVPSCPTTPAIEGVMDYGLQATTLKGEPVIIGWLFALGIGQRHAHIRLHAKQIGERLVATLNACAGLNPKAYRECVEVMRDINSWLSYGVPNPRKDRLRKKIQQALAHCKEI